ncbi:DNA-binding CsgD family transcriptional regulator [Methanococcus maripaludis]|uniref:DNA-binding CsgD family transcriptional regulator n=1 Tax=Methanococcus maripaludis TaxID=39152 RepID=A0A7J9NVL6_METMI|nr:DNA-binding CsgD family transcriptional regulator [Methanococcus maripaludis]
MELIERVKELKASGKTAEQIAVLLETSIWIIRPIYKNV